MIRIQDDANGFVCIEARGKLDDRDYAELVPELEEALERRGRLRVLILLRDFEGWTRRALGDELRFDLRHRDDFDRTAIVGEGTLEKWATRLSAPFFSGEVRFFEREGDARAWLTEDGKSVPVPS